MSSLGERIEWCLEKGQCRGFFSRSCRVVTVSFILHLLVALAGLKIQKNKYSPHTIDAKRWVKKEENSSDDEVQDIFEEEDYVSVLGIGFPGILERNIGV